MNSVSPGARLGTVILILASIFAVALFPVASLHGPYCTVHGPATDTLPEHLSALLKLLFLIFAIVTSLLSDAQPTAVLARISRCSHYDLLHDGNLDPLDLTCNCRR